MAKVVRTLFESICNHSKIPKGGKIRRNVTDQKICRVYSMQQLNEC